jgi:hypothetical protein
MPAYKRLTFRKYKKLQRLAFPSFFQNFDLILQLETQSFVYSLNSSFSKMIKFCKLFLCIFFINSCFAQTQNAIDNQKIYTTVSEFKKLSYSVQPHKTLSQKIEIKNPFAKDTTYFINMGREEIGFLYEVNSGKLLAKNGASVPILERSVKKDLRILKINIKAKEVKTVELSIENFLPNAKTIEIKLLDYTRYQTFEAELFNDFHHKYGQPGYLGILILILLLAIIQYFVLPERVFIYYIFYLFFIIIRTAGYNELLVLEDIFPILNRIHYSTLNSQALTYLSFVFYVLFLREFTGFAIKKPHLDFFFTIHFCYLSCFIIFDLFFPNEKYSNPQINNIFRALETIGLIMGLISLVLLFRVYDTFNRFVLWGAAALLIIGILGQEILKRNFKGHAPQDQYYIHLTVIWSIAYFVEFMFFTISLVSRQKILLGSIRVEQEKNKELAARLASQNKVSIPESTINYESFSLSTNKGVLVFQQSDIQRLEASGSYTIFCFQNQKQILASYSLAEFEQKLNPAKFVRVHKSHLVNLSYVAQYTKGDGGILTLKDGVEVPVSRSRKEELLNKLSTV